MNNDNWRDDAKCADPELNPNIWFSDPAEEKERDDIQRARHEMCTARDICRLCPVRIECLEYALYRPFLQGIWGGLSADERDTMRMVRARGDDTLVFGLFPEPDLGAYVGAYGRTMRSPAIVKALQARRVCKECNAEKDYYISRNLGCCEECAMKKPAQDEPQVV